jgi:peptide methionine sulfoxide reductase MsrA
MLKVAIEFDPIVLDPLMLCDCFLAMHDHTKVRAHGKHAEGTGQYRSCIFLPARSGLEAAARSALQACEGQLGVHRLSTEVRTMDSTMESWFWEAEERHQKHDEKRGGFHNFETLNPARWLENYGRRTKSVIGSPETVPEAIEHTRLLI